MFPHQRTPLLPNRRDTTSNSNLLQLKLRRLLNEPNKETLSNSERLSCDHFLIGSPSKSYNYKTHDASASISNQNRGIFSSPKRFTQKVNFQTISAKCLTKSYKSFLIFLVEYLPRLRRKWQRFGIFSKYFSVITIITASTYFVR